MGTALFLLAAAVFCLWPAAAQAQEDLRSKTQQIKQQLAEMDALKAKLAELEGKLEESQKTQKAGTSTVTTCFKGVKAGIDGRIFLGAFKSGSQGPDPNWSTDIPDAKLRFTFNPSNRITVVNRLSTSGARSADFDYFYLDYAGIPNPASVLRLGQRKIDFGQETWTDNPIENILISNSVSHISGYATGIAIRGKLSNVERSPVYEIGVVNGAKGQMARQSSGLQTNVKLGTPLPGNLFVSASYFDTGTLKGTDKAGLSIAEINDAPSGATEWKRTLWELDLRYNYGLAGIRSMVPSRSIPSVMVGATWGKFSDSASGAADRDGRFWFIEGLYNLTSRLYAAGRRSTAKLDGGALARLSKSPVDVNSYCRTSIGLGYRLTNLTDLKTEYTTNDTSGGPSEPSLNQWAIGIAAKF